MASILWSIENHYTYLITYNVKQINRLPYTLRYICIMSFHNHNGCVNVHIQFLKILFYFGSLLKFITNMEFKSSSYKMQNIKQTFFFWNSHKIVYADTFMQLTVLTDSKRVTCSNKTITLQLDLCYLCLKLWQMFNFCMY